MVNPWAAYSCSPTAELSRPDPLRYDKRIGLLTVGSDHSGHCSSITGTRCVARSPSFKSPEQSHRRGAAADPSGERQDVPQAPGQLRLSELDAPFHRPGRVHSLTGQRQFPCALGAEQHRRTD